MGPLSYGNPIDKEQKARVLTCTHVRATLWDMQGSYTLCRESGSEDGRKDSRDRERPRNQPSLSG